MTTLLDQLNERQREAVQYCDGPELVIAGAGSGKTRVLTYKIAYLLQHPELNLAPWNILALTFTNKAAREMKERVAKLVGEDMAAGLNMGTFHSVFARILRREAAAIGYTSSYTIYDEADARSLVGTIVKELGLDTNKYKPANVRYNISMAKNRLVTAGMYADNLAARQADEQNDTPETATIYNLYEQRCKAANAMDFDDLLLNTYLLFKNNHEVCRHYAARYRYVLVDEYQDTNYAQQCIVSQLTLEHQNICVVGDDAQSIYGFRGANIDNILELNKLFPALRTFKLERNYRSTQRIVEAANTLIWHNEWQIRKEVYSKNVEGEPIEYCSCYSDKAEAQYVAREISRIRRREGLGYGDFAILYRTNSQSRCFEEEFSRQGVPYRIYGGLSFYQRKEIKDIFAYLRAVVNPDDEEAIKRIINTPKRAIGATTISKIAARANDNGVSFWQVLTDPDTYRLDVNKGTRGKLDKFAYLISSLGELATKTDAARLAEETIRQSGLHGELFGDDTPEGKARQENVEELMNQLHDFVDTKREEGLEEEAYISNFVQEAALLTDSDNGDDAESKVSLMTIHAAKGLEFPTVFVVGMEENIFPGQRSAGNPRMLEEERRLLYVAITRAEKHCYLTCAKTRYRYGHIEYDIPSRFIKDIAPQYIHAANGAEDMSMERPSAFGGTRQRATYASMETTRQVRTLPSSAIEVPRRRPAMEQGASAMARMAGTSQQQQVMQATTPTGVVSVGDKIAHQRFGRGEVLAIVIVDGEAKATVKFDEAGQKQLLLKYARLEVVKGE